METSFQYSMLLVLPFYLLKYGPIQQKDVLQISPVISKGLSRTERDSLTVPRSLSDALSSVDGLFCGAFFCADQTDGGKTEEIKLCMTVEKRSSHSGKTFDV